MDSFLIWLGNVCSRSNFSKVITRYGNKDCFSLPLRITSGLQEKEVTKGESTSSVLLIQMNEAKMEIKLCKGDEILTSISGISVFCSDFASI